MISKTRLKIGKMDKLAFDKTEAARLLSLKESSIDWLLRTGALPHRKIAGKIRFTESDIRALIDTSAVSGCCAGDGKEVNS